MPAVNRQPWLPPGTRRASCSAILRERRARPTFPSSAQHQFCSTATLNMFFEYFSQYRSNSELSCIQSDAADHSEVTGIDFTSVAHLLLELSSKNHHRPQNMHRRSIGFSNISHNTGRIQSSRAYSQTRLITARRLVQMPYAWLISCLS